MTLVFVWIRKQDFMQLPNIILGQIDFFIILKNRRKQIGVAGDFLLIARLKWLFADMIKDSFNLCII